MSDQRRDVPGSGDQDASWRPPEINHNSDAEEDTAATDRLYRQAYDEGYAEGLAAGHAKAEQIVADMNTLLAAIKAPLHESVSVVLDELLMLVEKSVEAVLERELEMGGADINQIVERSLEALGNADAPAVLSLHPTDAALCRELGLVEDQSIVLIEDATLHRGGVKIRAGSRSVDASVETRLQEVLAGLHARRDLDQRASDEEALTSVRSEDTFNGTTS
ncbi:MAG: FliH/SctL family protein [Pseudomonadota bacterium]